MTGLEVLAVCWSPGWGRGEGRGVVPWLEAGRGVARLEREGGRGGAQETGARLYFVILVLSSSCRAVL